MYSYWVVFTSRYVGIPPLPNAAIDPLPVNSIIFPRVNSPSTAN